MTITLILSLVGRYSSSTSQSENVHFSVWRWITIWGRWRFCWGQEGCRLSFGNEWNALWRLDWVSSIFNRRGVLKIKLFEMRLHNFYQKSDSYCVIPYQFYQEKLYLPCVRVLFNIWNQQLYNSCRDIELCVRYL